MPPEKTINDTETGDSSPHNRPLKNVTGKAGPDHDAVILKRAIKTAKQRLQDLAPPSAPKNNETVNPTLALTAIKNDGMLLSYKRPNGEIIIREANDNDLLALKIIVDDIDPWLLTRKHSIHLGLIDRVINQARTDEIILAPPPLISRPDDWFKGNCPILFKKPATFTLQWHITQACDLHCRHCYDRSNRSRVEREDGERILAQFRRFCDRHHLRGQVSFSGGNPLLHPDFFPFYQKAADLGLGTAILGNPCEKEKLERIKATALPAFYQISLEGLAPTNDHIRGPGHFKRSLEFLDLLREKGIFSMVMLTLQRENQDQVLRLAEYLRGRCDLFTFNRLSQTGEGGNLAGVDREFYPELMESYHKLSQTMDHVALKDNFFNIYREQCGDDLFGGCTGYGCGAAFNFISLLPDGEVHACRKFPSKIGNIHRDDIDTIYHSDLAEAYRRGPEECADCRIKPVCRGCLAVASGCGLDPLKKHDPYCFI